MVKKSKYALFVAQAILFGVMAISFFNICDVMERYSNVTAFMSDKGVILSSEESQKVYSWFRSLRAQNELVLGGAIFIL